jgi:hypothetical protein
VLFRSRFSGKGLKGSNRRKCSGRHLNARTLTVLVSVMSLVLFAFPLVAQAAATYYTPISCSQTEDTVNFNFQSTNTSANIVISLAQGTTWSDLKADVGVGTGVSVALQLIDPTSIVQGTTVASGAPNSLHVSDPVSGQWSLHLTSQNNIASGQSVPITVTVTGTSSSCNSPLYPIIILLVILVIAVFVGVAFVMRRGKGEGAPAIPPSGAAAPSTAAGTQVVQRGTATYFAALELPGGQTIPMTKMTQDFGRADFEPLVPKEVSGIISRRHFQISLSARDKKFYIEDVGSTNGTIVNSTDIRGKGKVPLNSGDTVSPADVINLKFKG